MFPMYGVITFVVEYNMCRSLHITNLTSHQTKTFIFVFGLQCNLIFLDNHLTVYFPELNCCASC